MPTRSNPVMPFAPFLQCTPGKHVPIAGPQGSIISPRVHYGDGLDGRIECLACRKIIGEVTPEGKYIWTEEEGE